MPITTISENKTERLEILGADGAVDRALLPELSQEVQRDIYRKLVQLRVFDDRAFKLQRQGRLGTYPQIIGQEVSQLVPALCLEKKDWMAPTYRGQGSYFGRGMRLRDVLLYWGGDDRGTRFAEDVNDVPWSVPVAAHLTQVAGMAWAEKLNKSKAVALAFVGDGSSSKGDMHEAMIFAGVWKLPMVLIIENNQFAISTRRENTCGAASFAQRAHGYGAHGVQADGNDVFATYKAVSEAVARARAGEGPSIVELVTYRRGHHTTADDATRYRDPAELAEWEKKDPIDRYRKYLLAEGILTAGDVAKIEEEAQAFVKKEIADYENVSKPNPLDMFTENYATAPWHLVEQRAELAEILEEKRSRNEIEELPPAEGRFP